jgi:hypothetical protein
MSSKSKYNRRNISQNKTESAAPSNLKEASAAPAIERSPKSNPAGNTAARAMLDMSVAVGNFKTELKYISLVAVIMVACLIASYYIFR